jgi:hypothetical protein
MGRSIINRKVPRPVSFLLLGIVSCWIAGEIVGNPLPLSPRSQIIPAAYRLPKIPGGTSLRLAMVHDVLHERYLRHGSAWYAQRNSDALKIIAEQTPPAGGSPSIQYLDAMDDLAVGLERTGQSDKAIAVLQKKLLLIAPLPAVPATRPAFIKSTTINFQYDDRFDLDRILAAQNLSPIAHHQYTTFANLGTIRLLDVLPKVLAGNINPGEKSQMTQCLEDIERSIAINPGGHFGREVWQAILIEHLLVAYDHAELLDQFDMIGEPLAKESEWWEHVFDSDYGRTMPNLSETNMSADRRVQIRCAFIPRLGIDPAWATLVNPDYNEPMPFDEPTLAIIGMWTLGGGPNAHFALALGRIMQNIGQRQIAWNGYERAVELKDSFWPDPIIRQKFVDICRDRQGEIAKLEDPTHPDAWQQKMRAQHLSELAWGLAYQNAYQDFEASQIKAGVPLDDPNFYAKFFQGRPSIASAPGLADDIVVTHLKPTSWVDLLPTLVLGAGLGLALGVVIPEKIIS